MTMRACHFLGLLFFVKFSTLVVGGPGDLKRKEIDLKKLAKVSACVLTKPNTCFHFASITKANDNARILPHAQSLESASMRTLLIIR
jgi:hypothetical protein